MVETSDFFFLGYIVYYIFIFLVCEANWGQKSEQEIFFVRLLFLGKKKIERNSLKFLKVEKGTQKHFSGQTCFCQQFLTFKLLIL